MSLRTRIIIVALPVILLAASLLKMSVTQSSARIRPQNVPVVMVELPRRQAIEHNLELTGDLLPIQQAQVFARVYGNLQAVLVNMGDYVRRNQLLARIDTTELAQQYREAQATYENTSSNFDRVQALQQGNLTSRQDFDNAQTALKVATAAYDNARTRLDYAQVTAPFSGFITRRFLDPGALLTSTNATLFTLMDIDVMKVVINLLEKDIPAVKIGTKAIVKADAYPETEFTGSVVRQSQALELATRTMAIEVDIPNPNRILKPGMFATVTLVLSRQDSALTVPSQVIFQDKRGRFVYVADHDTAHRKDVTVGSEQQSRTEITAGLQDSDQVIVVGQQFARDGGPVRIQP